MSYVSVWKPTYDKIINASTENSSNEVIGLLIGKLEGDTLVVNDSVTGEFSGEPHRVVLNPVTIAKIADDFLKGRLKGNIVGWYHSHTEDGLFFSQTDVETQKRFQQFSRLTLGMVVDATNGDAGFFRIDDDGNAARIPQARIRVYEKTETPQLPASPTVPRRRRRRPTKKLIVGVALIALVISIALLGSILYRTSSPVLPIIAPNSPILSTVAGSSIPITVNTTGLADLTLFYALDGGSFTQVSMTSNKPGVFQYTIPGSQVTSNLTYYMEGTVGSSVRITTKPYQVRVSDFSLQLGERITVYRNATKPTLTKLNLTSINGFSNSVTLSTNELPNNITVSFPATQSISGTSLNVSIAADANTPLQTFPLFISASYASPNSQTITRTSRILVTVTDFNMDVSPSTLSTDLNGQASFEVNVTLAQGFTAPIRLTFIGLPEGAKIQLAPSTNTIQLTGLSNMSFNLQVTAMKQGTYTVILTALAVLQNGDFISHSQIIQLTVR